MDFFLTYDGVIVGILLLFALVGYISGALRQIFSMVALVLAYVLAVPVGRVIARILVERYDGAPSASEVMGRFLAGFGIFMAAKLFFLIVNYFLGRGQVHRNPLNRLVGALLGAGKALVILWLLFCLIAQTSKLDVNLPWGLAERMETSKIATWMVRMYNPVARLRVMTTMRKLRVLARHPGALENLADDPKVEDLLDKVRASIIERTQSDDLPGGVRSGQPEAIVGAARLRDFIPNQETLDALLNIDVEAAVERAYKDLPQEPETDS